MNEQILPTSFPSDDRPTFFSSFEGLRERAVLSVLVVSGTLAVSGTSSADPTKVWEEPYVYEADATVCGSGRDQVLSGTKRDSETTRHAVSELRRISGLTWDQVGQLFDVSRRSVHHWASGKPLNAANEERLMRVLDVVRFAYRGSARETRAALMDAGNGTTPFDMLAAQRFDEARAVLGQGRGRTRPTLSKLTAGHAGRRDQRADW
jgi:DNA-binding transcriptional regulator YiaG